MVLLSVLFQYLFKLPRWMAWHLHDLFFYIKEKGWKRFEGWGLHLYVGAFGAGKTSSMVHDAYALASRYKCLTIVTNVKLQNFPKWTRILPLHSPQDILNAPENTLVVIDEIGTIFNSRDFAKSKDSVPKILFQHLCQCRKRHMMIYATTQRWNFLDKQLRDITATVRVTRTHFAHPFSRICTVWRYDAPTYDLAYSNPMVPLRPLRGTVYIQTNKIRSLYDTSELVQSMLSAEYISDEEILANQGEAELNLQYSEKKSQNRRVGRNLKAR